MPTYEYQCIECGHRFDVWQSVGEAPPACAECGAAVKKIFHPARVIFKGSGFYVTDTRAEKEAKSSSKNGSSEDGAAKPASGDSGGDAGKVESKSEAKTTESTQAVTSSDKTQSDNKK